MAADPAARPASSSTRYPSIVRPSIVYLVLFTAIGAWFPYIAIYYRSIGISIESIGLLSALAAGVGMIAAPIWGAIADRLGSVRLPLVVAGVWAGAAGVVLASARDPLVIATSAALLSVGLAGLGPMLDSRTIQLFGSGRDRYGRARAWGSIAFIVGALVVGALLDRTGPEGLFLVFVPGIVLAGLAGYALLGSGGRGTGTRLTGLARADLAFLRHRTIGLFFIGSILMWTMATAVYTFFPIHLVGIGADVQLVGVASALAALIEVPLMFAFPTLSRRIGGERLLVLAAVAWALRSAVWSLIGDPVLLVAFAPLGGIGFALFYVGTVTYLGRVVPETILGTAQGLFTGTAFSLGTIVGGAIGGQLGAALGIQGLFAICAAGTMAAGIVVWWAIVPARRSVGLGQASDAAAG